jgi:translation initiation factor 4A
LKCYFCIGGTSVREDIAHLRDSQHVVVGTPGRVLDMISKKHLQIEDLITFVLDEADEMLSCGFK